MKIKLLLIICIFSFKGYSTGGYWSSYYYEIIVCDDNGTVMRNNEITINNDDSTYISSTDSLGLLSIYLGGSENCKAGSKIFQPKDWSWVPSSLSISYQGKTFDINKNWKKHFRRKRGKTELYNYESGEISRIKNHLREKE